MDKSVKERSSPINSPTRSTSKVESKQKNTKNLYNIDCDDDIGIVSGQDQRDKPSSESLRLNDMES